jgi:hypothetical protein
LSTGPALLLLLLLAKLRAAATPAVYLYGEV